MIDAAFRHFTEIINCQELADFGGARPLPTI